VRVVDGIIRNHFKIRLPKLSTKFVYGIDSCISTFAFCISLVICNSTSVLVRKYKGRKWCNEWLMIVMEVFLVSECGRGHCNKTSPATFIDKLFFFLHGSGADVEVQNP